MVAFSDSISLALVVLIITSVAQIYFWIFQIGRLRIEKAIIKSSSFVQPPDVTLIIAAKDELSNIKQHLQSWLNQDYPDYKVIIVDDHSIDQTSSYLSTIVDPRLSYLSLPESISGKKAALAYAIEQSDSAWIVTTDADCRPESDHWLTTLLASSDSSDVILGYSPYIQNSTWLSTWISYEAWYVAAQYMTAAMAGWAYMGVGRNLAFRRSVYDEVGGYSDHMDLKSGDDDLFINSLDDRHKFSIALDSNSWVNTSPSISWRAYLRQKRRHLTTSPRYPNNIQLRLIIIYGSQLLWYSSVFVLLFYHMEVALFSLAIRYLVIFVVFRHSPLRGKSLKPSWAYPLFDLGLCGFYLFMSLTYLQRKDEW